MNHPLSDMMMSSMGKIRDMIDVNTVIGEPIAAGDVTIIPVTKVSIGYGAGGATSQRRIIRQTGTMPSAAAQARASTLRRLRFWWCGENPCGCCRWQSLRPRPWTGSSSSCRTCWTRQSIFSSRSVLQKRKASNNFPRMKPARRGKLTPGDNNEARLFQNGGGCDRCRFPVPAGAGSKFFRQRQREERNSGGRADPAEFCMKRTRTSKA